MKTRGVPPSVQEIAEVIGEAPALALMAALGGKEIHIPQQIPLLGHPLNAVLDGPTVELLCYHFGGCRWQVPVGQHLKLSRRNEELRALRQSGQTIKQLVDRYKLTERRIFQILAEYPPESFQVEASNSDGEN